VQHWLDRVAVAVERHVHRQRLRIEIGDDLEARVARP
jgi:hypothetical protein